MKYTLILAALMAVGCGMNNKEIADQVKFCRDQGMGVAVFRDFGDGAARKIECDPSKTPMRNP